MRDAAIGAINAVNDAFREIEDPEMALDLAMILVALVLEPAPPSRRMELARVMGLGGTKLLEHMKR